MGRSIIPPRTMRHVSRQIRQQSGLGAGVLLTFGTWRQPQTKQVAGEKEEFHSGLFRKPRNWQFQTKPLFKKLNGRWWTFFTSRRKC
jgi:hypothetical protein